MSQDPTPPDPPADEHLIRYRVTAADADALRAFLAESGADHSCRPVAVHTDRGLTAQVLLTRAQLGAVRGTRAAGGVELEEVEDVTTAQRAARAEVATGDRFGSRGAVPRGLGRKE